MGIYEEKRQKTIRLIENAFLQILEEKHFEAITIGDITKKASINRGTFYLHFEDKYDLLNQIEQRLFKNIGNHIDELHSRYSSAQTFLNEQEQVADALFHSIKTYAPLLRIFLSNHGRAGFHLRFRDAFSKKVLINLEKNVLVNERLEAPMEYFVSFITSAFLGLIEQWVQNGLNKTPEEMTSIYIDIISYIQKK